MSALAVWREVDSERGSLGARVWLTGGEVCLGKRMWRVRWLWPDRRVALLGRRKGTRT